MPGVNGIEHAGGENNRGGIFIELHRREAKRGAEQKDNGGPGDGLEVRSDGTGDFVAEEKQHAGEGEPAAPINLVVRAPDQLVEKKKQSGAPIMRLRKGEIPGSSTIKGAKFLEENLAGLTRLAGFHHAEHGFQALPAGPSTADKGAERHVRLASSSSHSSGRRWDRSRSVP